MFVVSADSYKDRPQMLCEHDDDNQLRIWTGSTMALSCDKGRMTTTIISILPIVYSHFVRVESN